MRSELIIKGRSLAGSTDLTLLAPIRRGLVPSLESVTYRTRAKRLLATLNAGRTSSHEYSLLRVFSDAVDRVGKIHSVRVAIVERDESKGDPATEPDKILLAVTFDGGEESYLRVLWQKVGTLLDMIFCNTEGYVTACGEDGKGGRFEAWADWVRGVQIETDFFYGMPAHTVDDVQYQREEELIQRRTFDPATGSRDLLAARHEVRSAEELAWSLHVPYPKTYIVRDLGRQGLRALVLLYRLTAYYLPGTSDGRILHRAARELLQEFILLEEQDALEKVIKEGRKRFDEQITWLLREVEPRKVPDMPAKKPEPRPRDDVQFGIISPYPSAISHGCLVLLAFRGRAGAAGFLKAMQREVTREAVDPLPKVFVSVSVTYEGLRAIGLTEDELAVFPQEFREGMEARASTLGDYRTNHPRRWRLPTRNFPAATGQPVELSSVHAILHVRVSGDRTLGSLGATLDAKDPLRAIVAELQHKFSQDVDLLSVQPMARHLNDDGNIREHFGFADGAAQPVLDPAENGVIYNRNQIQLGELLHGYPNEAEEPDDPPKRRKWLHNGSFLVVRKLSQDVKAFEDAVGAAAAATGLDRELIYAKLMGRWRNGQPIVPLLAGHRDMNDFDFRVDVPPGSKCPLHAHIRRVNPRQTDKVDLKPSPGRRTPRLMRRGMSYGPLYDPGQPGSESAERGLVFMAYNASIAEQFEVLQRWLSGGNSSAGYSGQSDPLLGVAPNAEQRFFRFEHEGLVHRIALDGATAPLADPRPFVRLEWGAYLFTPSIEALEKLADTATRQDGVADAPVWSAEDGERRIRELLTLYPVEKHGDKEETEADGKKDAAAIAAWKALLEDPEAQRRFISAGVWAAIRKYRHGVLRTQYGVIVADGKLIAEVLDNREGYSVSGYHERMEHTIGEIFLGLDDDGSPQCPYRVQSEDTVKAIGALTKEDAFNIVRKAASEAIAALVKNEISIAQDFGDPAWELSLDVKEVVDSALAALCQSWFGLPKQPCEIEPGGTRWDWDPAKGDPVRYPGHFTAPSRYFFQPHPGDEVEEYGRAYGVALRQAFAKLIARHMNNPKNPVFDPPDAPVTKAILGAFPGDPDLAGRTMAGALMGFLPTLDGNIRLTLNEWLRDGTFWSLRNALLPLAPGQEFRNAEDLLEPTLRRTMQLRPSPELIWRTPKRHGLQIGREEVGPRDRIVLSIVSATQHCLEARKINVKPDVYPIFGGMRRKNAPPTHACPGYEAAMGALLGFVSALLEVEDSMRPSLAPLALTLEGKLPARTRTIVPRTWYMRVFLWFRRMWWGAAPEAAEKPVLIADGDSWMSYAPWGPLGKAQNIAAYLEDRHDFDVRKIASPGTRLYSFYDNGQDNGKDDWTPVNKPEASSRRLDRLVQKVEEVIGEGKRPVAILLSVGGNDVVEERLLRLLSKNAPQGKELDMGKVGKQVDVWMEDWLTKVLLAINKRCKYGGVAIPVFLHGYDYPVPDARALRGVSEDRSWLWTHFRERKYEQSTFPFYPARCTPAMQTLIEYLNVMQERVAKKAALAPYVFHVRLTRILSSAPVNYVADWDNELHPSELGFTTLTGKFAEAIRLHALRRP